MRILSPAGRRRDRGGATRTLLPSFRRPSSGRPALRRGCRAAPGLPLAEVACGLLQRIARGLGRREWGRPWGRCAEPLSLGARAPGAAV